MLDGPVKMCSHLWMTPGNVETLKRLVEVTPCRINQLILIIIFDYFNWELRSTHYIFIFTPKFDNQLSFDLQKYGFCILNLNLFTETILHKKAHTFNDNQSVKSEEIICRSHWIQLKNTKLLIKVVDDNI